MLESFEDIENLTEELRKLRDQLIEAGWSKEQVSAYINKLLDEQPPEND